MLIKCVKSVPLYGCRFAEGNCYNVDAALGRQMIETQLAVLVDVDTGSHKIGTMLLIMGVETATGTTYKWSVSSLNPACPLTVEAAD
jgi:hypothetical protein